MPVAIASEACGAPAGSAVVDVSAGRGVGTVPSRRIRTPRACSADGRSVAVSRGWLAPAVERSGRDEPGGAGGRGRCSSSINPVLCSPCPSWFSCRRPQWPSSAWPPPAVQPSALPLLLRPPSSRPWQRPSPQHGHAWPPARPPAVLVSSQSGRVPHDRSPEWACPPPCRWAAPETLGMD